MIRFLKTAGILLLLAALLVLLAVVILETQPRKEAPMRYPMEYTGLIRENAYLQGIEPEYASAIILAESSYNPQAVSGVNAQGLMQIVPKTGKWIAGKFDESYVEGSLFSPEVNIRYGCWYLGYLLRRYDGDKVCATAAYHAGQGEVDSWLANPAFSYDGKTLYAMEGEKTTTYVDRVMKYYEKYKEIYAEEAV